MEKKYKLSFAILIILIILLIVDVIYRKPTVIHTIPDNHNELVIDSLNKVVKEVSSHVDKYTSIIDSLNKLPIKIKYIYHEKKAIIPSATINTLDSILLSECGLR